MKRVTLNETESSQQANKASREIFASQSGNIGNIIIKINGTNSVNFVGNSVNFVGNMLSNRNFS